MRHLIIGDIHGCFDELQELLQRAGLGADDQIVALGDAVDRGPDSVRVLEFLRANQRACSLMGNHERKHIRSFNNELRPALSQKITRRQLGEQDYPNACALMKTFPRHLVLEEAVLVHGFWEPGVALQQQRDTVVIGTLSGQRHLDESLARPWYELYDGDRPLICGHHDYLRTGEPLVVQDRVFCLDTSCCRGGRLTGLLLPDFRFVSVPARADHWSAIQDRYADLRFAGEHDQAEPWDKIRTLLAVEAQRDDLDPRFVERLARLKETVQQAERQMAALLKHVLDDNARIMDRLRAAGPHDELTDREQGSAYARALGESPLAGWFHLARRGQLDLEALRKRLKTPDAVFELARRLGIQQ